MLRKASRCCCVSALRRVCSASASSSSRVTYVCARWLVVVANMFNIYHLLGISSGCFDQQTSHAFVDLNHATTGMVLGRPKAASQI
jgi:hypothetical protein